jgi:hypothetical protein
MQPSPSYYPVYEDLHGIRHVGQHRPEDKAQIRNFVRKITFYRPQKNVQVQHVLTLFTLDQCVSKFFSLSEALKNNFSILCKICFIQGKKKKKAN